MVLMPPAARPAGFPADIPAYTIYADGVIQAEVKLARRHDLEERHDPGKRQGRLTLDEYRARTVNFPTTICGASSQGQIFGQWDDTKSQKLAVEAAPAHTGTAHHAVASARRPRFQRCIRCDEALAQGESMHLNYGPHLDALMLDERSYRGPTARTLKTTYGTTAYSSAPIQLAWPERALLKLASHWK